MKRSEASIRIDATERGRPAYEVARIVVTVGAEKFQPLSYNSFEVASITMVVDLPKGADVEAVYADAYDRLRGLQEAQLRSKTEDWIRHYREARERVREE